MIRYRLNERVDLVTACTCAHPALKRLEAFGPWQAKQEGNATVLTRKDQATRTDWSPWRPGLQGLEFSVPEPLPAFALVDWEYPAHQRREGIPVRLRCGVVVPVVPAYLEGAEMELDGSLGAPVSDYGRLVKVLWDRTGSGEVPPTDPAIRQFVHLAMASGLALPPEAAHAWRLLATSDVQPLFDAATSLPKAEAGEPSSSSAPPASTPEE